MAVETATPASDFARRFNNIIVELQLQTGIHKRIENLLNDFSHEHPNIRASFFSRELDDSYLQDGICPPEAAARPKLHAVAIDNERLYEFVAFSQGFRRDTVSLSSIVHIQETWIETKPDLPFIFRIALYHTFPSATILMATAGETQDAARDFLSRLKYLRGW